MQRALSLHSVKLLVYSLNINLFFKAVMGKTVSDILDHHVCNGLLIRTNRVIHYSNEGNTMIFTISNVYGVFGNGS